MIKTTTILTFIMTFFLTNCGKSNDENRNKEQQINSHKIDTSAVAILPFNASRHLFFKDNDHTDLTNDDLLRVETILIKCIQDYNAEQDKNFKELNSKHPEYKIDKDLPTINLKNYKRQYIATLNSKGEKEVWVNCFCAAWKENWKNDLIIVKDGGNCFFHLKINVTTKKYYDLMINGNA